MAKQEFDVKSFLGDESGSSSNEGGTNEGGSANQGDAGGEKSKGQGDQGSESGEGDDDDYSLEALNQESEPENQDLLEAIKKEGYKPGDDLKSYLEKLNLSKEARNQVLLPEGVDENGLSNENKAAIKRIETLLDDNQTSMEERIRKALEFEYKNRLSEEDLEAHIEEILSDPVKRVSYDDNILKALRNQETQIRQNAKEALVQFRQKHEAAKKKRQEALYNSRQLFGSTLKPEVLRDIDSKIASGDFSKELADPANEAKLALLWYHQEMIADVFSQPNHLDGLEEGKKQFFLRTTNSQVSKSGVAGQKSTSKQGKGFDVQAFISDD